MFAMVIGLNDWRRSASSAGGSGKAEPTKHCTVPLPKIKTLRRARRLKIALALECETNSGTNHAEIVVRAIDHVPTEVVHDADMRSNPDFNASAKLADAFGV